MGSNVPYSSIIADFAGPSVVSPVLGNPIKKEDGLNVGLTSPVIEFEKVIAQFCCPGEKNAMMVFWNCLSASEKEGFVHGLRFTKKKYNSGSDAENSIEDSIDNIKKISSVSQRNELLLNLEASQQQEEGEVGETVVSLLPEGIPVSEDNEPVAVDLGEICSMQALAKVKKEKGKFEIDEMVSKQLEEVCNNIVYHFPSKFSHLDIVNEGEFKFNYVDEEIEGKDGKMAVDDKVILKENAKNNNGGLLISDVMLENAKFGKAQEKIDLPQPNPIGADSIVGEQVSYANKVSGKKLNAANLISVIKKDPILPKGVVEMPYCDILKEEVMVNDEGVYFFRFSSEQGLISVLEGGVWMIFDSALVVRRWTTGVSSVKGQHDKVPVWVKIFNVPLEYWNGTGLSHIAWEIGKPLDVDAHTASMCQDHWGRPAFMRVLIEMSASKDWLKEVQVYSSDLTTGERILSKCRIEYVWNPSKCSHCKVYGHKDSNCGILLAKQGIRKNNNNKSDFPNGENQGSKGKGIQGYNGKSKNLNGRGVGSNFEQGQNSKTNFMVNKGSGSGVFMADKGNLGSMAENRVLQENNKEGTNNREVNMHSYIPKSGMDFKISSNFDKNYQNVKGAAPVKSFFNNQFAVLNDLGDENQFVYLKKGIDEADLAYLDTVDQMEVLGGVPVIDTNMEAGPNGD
ncbi:unnamed protein product [Lactuca virosa]|uniref:DUF4283 domain-containing protein n=1 Tax=Lactuca virosa TaxID=75947 RepID=A0AAU9MQI7_9ASTR|nr:unnamed protein product [Lactuca virosa]